MKKRMLAILFCSVLALSACAGKDAENTGRGKVEDEEEEEAEATPTEAPETDDPEPTEEPEIVEEDELYGWDYVPELDGMEVCGLLYTWRPYGGAEISNTEPAVVKEQYYVVRNEDRFGLMDINGNWIAEPIYANVSYGYDFFLCDGYEYEDQSYTLQGGKLVALGEDGYPEINGTSPDGTCYWDDINEKLSYFDQSNMDGIDYEYDGTIACRVAESDWQGDAAAFNPFGIVTDGEAVTDFVFEDASAFSDGLIAVKSDGKWGYANADGYEVIPCEYEGIRATEYYYDLELRYFGDHYPESYTEGTIEEYIKNWEDRFFAASCTDGYVVLCKDGDYALYTRDYEEAVPFGLFEEISEVTKGKFFAKLNGEWGICTLE